MRDVTTPKVSVGLATQAGLSTTVVAYVLAIVAFIEGDRSEETVAALALGTAALVTTLWGRFAQAKEAIRASRPQSVTVNTSAAVPIATPRLDIPSPGTTQVPVDADDSVHAASDGVELLDEDVEAKEL